MNKDVETLLKFFHYLEGLKKELRQLWLSDKRQEDSAEHSWRMAVIIMLVAPKLTIRVNIEKAIKMALIHDVVEIEAGDTPLYEHHDNPTVKKDKEKRERKAINNISALLGIELGRETYDLWYEYENQQTNEAKLVKAVDIIEARVQFIDDPNRTYTQEEFFRSNKVREQFAEKCKIDPFVSDLEQTSLKEITEKIEIMQKTGRILK